MTNSSPHTTHANNRTQDTEVGSEGNNYCDNPTLLMLMHLSYFPGGWGGGGGVSRRVEFDSFGHPKEFLLKQNDSCTGKITVMYGISDEIFAGLGEGF